MPSTSFVILSASTEPSAVIIYFWTIVFGLVVGSFLNVCIHRLPAGKSLVWPGSHCPNCMHNLVWRDLVPVFSYVFLGGRCRYCREAISPRYPLVEMGNAVIWCLAVDMSGSIQSVVLTQLFFSALLTLSMIDLSEMIIPDVINLIIIALGIARQVTADESGLLNGLQGAVLGGGSLLLISLLSLWIWRREGIGGGDVKMMTVCGFWLGWRNTAVALCLSPYLALTGVAVWRLAGRALPKDRRVPFGPALSLACLLAAVWGEAITAFLL